MLAEKRSDDVSHLLDMTIFYLTIPKEFVKEFVWHEQLKWLAYILSGEDLTRSSQSSEGRVPNKRFSTCLKPSARLMKVPLSRPPSGAFEAPMPLPTSSPYTCAPEACRSREDYVNVVVIVESSTFDGVRTSSKTLLSHGTYMCILFLILRCEYY